MYPVNNRLHTLAFEENVKTRIRVYFISDSVDCTDDSDVQTNGTLLVGAAGDTDSNGRISFDQGVTFNEYFNPDKNIQIGTAVSSNVTMTLLNYDGALDGFSYGRCKIYLDAYDDENSVWLPCPMGVYIIDLPVKRKTKLVNVIGYDQMQKLDAVCDSWWNGLGWSSGLTILQILNSMATHLGMSVSSATASKMVNSGLSFTAAPFDCVEVTYREVLETIAEATGTVAKFNRDGELELRWFSLPSGGGDFGDSNCFSLDVAEYNVSQIDALRLKFADGDIGVTIGSGTNEYVIQNNLFLNGANTAEITSKANPVYNRLSSFSQYAPVSGKMIYDWSLEAGDIIIISTFSATLIVPVFQSSISWHGGYVVADVFCDGDEKRPVLDAALRDYYRLDSDMRTLVIEAPRINLLGYTTINDGFRVNLDGTFEANGATIAGSLKTKSGAKSVEMTSGMLRFVRSGNTLFSMDYDSGLCGIKLNANTNNGVRQVQITGAGGPSSGVALYDTDGTTIVSEMNCSGELRVGTSAGNNLKYDPVNGLSVDGGAAITGNATVFGNISATGNITSNGTITASNLSVNNDLTADTASVRSATVSGNATVSGDATISGVLDVTKRHSYSNLPTVNNGAGWYRVMIGTPIGYQTTGVLIKFHIIQWGDAGGVSSNHEITLSLTTSGAVFQNETSNGTQHVTKIRCNRSTASTEVYVDIYYDDTTVRTVDVFFEPYLYAPYRGRFSSVWFTKVDESPANETNLAVYNFSSDIRPTYLKQYVETSAANYTIGSGNYLEMDYPLNLTGNQVVSIGLATWSNNSGPFSIFPYGTSSKKWYIVGAAGTTINGARFKYWYID